MPTRKKTHQQPPMTFLRGFELALPCDDLGVFLANTAEVRKEKSVKSSRAELGVVQQPLESYADLVRWLRQVGSLDTAGVEELLRLADEQAEEAAAAFERVLELRRLFTRIAGALAGGKWPAREDLETLSATLDEIRPLRLRLVNAPGGAAWTRERPERSLEWPGGELVDSMAALLAAEQRPPVRRCAGEGCGVIFVDHSRQGRRRWCNMIACGNIPKTRRHRKLFGSG